MVSVAIGVLVFTGIATQALAYRTRVSDARSDIASRAPAVANALDNLRTHLTTQQERQHTVQGDRRVQHASQGALGMVAEFAAVSAVQ